MRTLFLLVCLISAVKIQAQDRILLRNPSFEGPRGAGIEIPGWYNCGHASETPPDLQPGAFGCKLEAIEGKSYIGMSARETGTWESICQKLAAPLQSGENYTFSLWLARSVKYLSGARGYTEPKNFTEPLRLRIWGGEGYCDRGELLAQTTPVENTDWMPFVFIFFS